MIVIQPDIIDRIEDVFNRWIIGGIASLSKTKGVSLTFVLIVCAIDYLASFNAGGKTTRKKYVDFLKEYKWFIKKYKPEDIYDSLRCGLVHNFTIIGGKYALTYKEPSRHRKTENIDGQKMIILNFKDFFKDFKRLKKEYFAKVRNLQENKTQNFLKRFRNLGFLLYIEGTKRAIN
jgi:hypothetical protein